MSSVVKLNGRSYYIDRRQFVRQRAKDYRNEPDPGERIPEERSVKANEIWSRVWNDFSLGTSQELADTPNSSSRRFHHSINFDPFRIMGELHIADRIEPYLETLGMVDFFQSPILMASNGVDIIANGANGIPGVPLTYFGNREEGFELVTGLNDSYWDITVWGDTFYFIDYGGNVVKVQKVYDDNILIPPVITVSMIGSVPGAGPPGPSIGIGNGRLVIGVGPKLYEMAADGTTTLIYTHPNSGFNWTGVEEASQGIYVWGWQTEGPQIYDAGVFFMSTEEFDGALAAPYKVLPLPEGEWAYDLLFYGGYVFVSTNVGIRMAQVNELGYLVYGPALEVPGASVLYGRGEKIYFGYSNYMVGISSTSVEDSSPHWGIGIIHLRELVDNLTPPFAMVYGFPGPGSTYPSYPTILSIGLDKDDTIFFVHQDQDELMFVNIDERASSGIIRLGMCSFATSESVRLLGTGIKGHSTQGNQVKFTQGIRFLRSATDPSGFTYDSFEALQNQQMIIEEDAPLDIDTRRAEVVLEYTNLTNSDFESSIFQVQLEATPMSFYSEKIILPVLFADWIRDDYGVDVSLDLENEWKILSDLMDNRTFITLKLGEETFRGFVQQLEMRPETLMEFSRPFENQDFSSNPSTEGMLSGFIYVTFHTIPRYV